MRIERTKNASRNIAVGMVQKVYQILVPFAVRTVMIYILGMEYLGLNSLFTSILQVLNLAELGVGSAMVFSMYRPIAQDDHDVICALLNLYRRYYRVIGLVILAVGVLLTPAVPYLISGGVPAGMNVYVLYLLNLGATVLSYWLFAYKNSLLTAYQRTDVISKVTIIVNTFLLVAQIGVLLIWRDYYIYLLVTLFSQVLQNVLTAAAADRLFPRYQPKGQLERAKVQQINRRVRDLVTSKIGEVIVNSADSIVISASLGLSVLAVYNSYYYILTSVVGFVMIVLNACMAGIGNSLVVESEEKNYGDFCKFTFILAWIVGFGSCCLLCLYQPFMTLWIGEEYLLPFGCVMCFVVYFYVRQINQLSILYKDAAGMWHEDRFRPLCTALTNLALNLLLVQKTGLYGVLLSTVLSVLLVGFPWVTRNLFAVVFKRTAGSYLKNLLYYGMVTLTICAATYGVCCLADFGAVGDLVYRAAVCICLPNLLYLLIFRRRQEWGETLALADTVLGGRLKRLGFRKNK